jgi:hypothetical protein
MLSGITGKAQKQGSAEAVPGGNKSGVSALHYMYIISQVCNICQMHKKEIFLFIINLQVQSTDIPLLVSAILVFSSMKTEGRGL